MNSQRRIFVAAALLALCFHTFAAADFGEPREATWTTPPDVRARLSSPALDEDNAVIYAGGSDGKLYTFSTDDGSLVNEPLRLGHGQCSPPLIGNDGIIYVAVADTSLVAVTNAASTNASVKWRYQTGKTIVGSPAMDTNGVIYIGSKDNRLHAIVNGRTKWTFDAKSDITSSPLITPEGNIVIVAGGSVFNLDPDGGQIYVFRAGASVNNIPVADDNELIYFGSHREFLYAIDGGSGGATNGSTNGIVWKIPTGANVQSSGALGADGRFYVGTDNRRVLCIDTNGGIAWKFPADGKTRGPVRGSVSIGADGTIYVGSDAHTLYAIRPDGAPKWFFDTGKGTVRSSPVIDSFGTVYVSAGRAIYAIEDEVESEAAPWPQFRRDAQHSAKSTFGEPFIQSQPVDVVTNAGATVTFSVVANSGAGVTYQWAFNGVDIDPDTNPTATNATLVLTNVSSSDSGSYDVLVSNDFGDAVSDSAQLTVIGLPEIVNNLTNVFVSVGSTVRLEVGAAGFGDLHYLWRSNSVDLINATNSFYIITNAQVSDSAVYQVIVSNGQGSTPSRAITVTVVPLNLSRSTNNAIAAGNQFSAAIITNQLFTWGSDSFGQLGDGGTANRNVPTRTSTNIDWLSISAGGRGNTNTNVVAHSLALRTDGSLYAWGANTRGQLGLGNTNLQRLPVRVGVDTNWIQVEAGADHSVGLRADGTIWTWGGNEFGQLGHNTTNRVLVPTQVGGDSGWVEVRAGGYFTLARRADNTIWGWGRNDSYQLSALNFSALSPVQIGTATNWIAISAGVNHSLALRNDGTLWVWGRRLGFTGNRTDQLTNTYSVPTQLGSATNWVAIDAGYDHSLAINNVGDLFAFGANNIGQLGNSLSGPTTGLTNQNNVTFPTQIGVGHTWTAIDAGVKHSLARASDGTIWAWGWNNSGQVGDGTGGDGTDQFNRKSPVQLTFNNFAAPNTNGNVNVGPPVFTIQPASTNLTNPGTVTFSASVTGAPLTGILWYFNTNTPIAGATNLTYTFVATNGNAGIYNAVVTNSSGVATSAFASLTFTTNSGGGLAGVPPRVAASASFLVNEPLTIAAKKLTNGFGVVLANTSATQSLVLEFKAHLSDLNWTAIATNPIGANAAGFVDTNMPAGSGFYRVRVQ